MNEKQKKELSFTIGAYKKHYTKSPSIELKNEIKRLERVFKKWTN